MKQYKFILFAVIAFFECCQPEHSTNKPVIIQPKTNYKTLSESNAIQLSGYFDSISYIKLQTDTTSGLIGEATKILYLPNRIIVFDKALAKSVFIFNGEGEFIKKISKGIGAPDEPMSLEDASCNKDNGTFSIYSGSQSLVFVYDKDGSLLRKVPAPQAFFSKIEMLNTGGFLFYKEIQAGSSNDILKNCRLNYVNEKGNIEKGWFNYIRNKNIQFPTPAVFFRKMYNGNILFQSSGLDTLLMFEPADMKEAKVFALFDFGKQQKQKAKLFTARNYQELQHIQSTICGVGEVPLVHARMILGTYTVNNKICCYLYNPSTAETLSGTDLINDIDGVPLSFLPCSFLDGDFVYMPVNLPLLRLMEESQKNWDGRFKDAEQETLILAKIHIKS